MKKFYLLLSAVALILIGSACSRQKSADASDLLASIPSDGSLVAVANLNELLVKSGCTVEEGKVIPSAEVSQSANSIADPSVRMFAQALVNGESGVDPSVMAFFVVGYYKYLTGVAADPSKFKELVEKHLGAKFATDNDVEVCDNFAVKGNRFWINLGATEIDAREVKHFATLAQDQSFLGNPASDRLATLNKDAAVWGDIAGTLTSFEFDFQQRAIAQMLMQALFDDASDMFATLSFDKGELKAEVNVLNAKAQPARYLLPVSKIDAGTVESLGGGAEQLAAIAVPHKMIEQLQKAIGTKGLSLIGMYLQTLGAVDGTVALAFGADHALNGLISTDGGSTTEMTSMLQDLGVKTRLDGKLVRIGDGALQGGQPVASLAKSTEDALAAYVIAPGNPTKRMFGFPADSGSLALKSEKGSVRADISLKSNQADENYLLTLLKTLSETAQ